MSSSRLATNPVPSPLFTGATREGNLRAMAWMLWASALMVAMNATIKLMTQELPVMVVFFFRMAFAVPLVLPWIVRSGPQILATERLGQHFVRAVFGALGMWCWVFGVKYLSLATFTAISFTRPLWMPFTAWLMLGERVNKRRGFLILFGFAGVLIAARPDMVLDVVVLVAILGGALSSVTMAQVKQLTATEPSVRIVFYSSVFGTLLGLPFAIADWATPSLVQLAWLALSAITAAAGQYCVARAATIGDATVITPIDFLQLPFAALAGFMIFTELPDLLTFAGAAIILLATLAIAREEQRRHAQASIQ
ncbi:MAG: DMT family transporter [Alphaproteobacteria bacterium]|nr:DMT family transporter [Alphaproteobacteria bacterium]